MRFGVWEIVLILVLVLILFSHNKIPAMMKNVADGLKVFKKELKTEQPAAAKSASRAGGATKKSAPKKPAAKNAVKKNETKSATYVEFGAYASMAAANSAMRRIMAAHGELIGDHEFVVLEEGTKPAFKLRIAFGRPADARAFVADAVARNLGCAVVV